jgi:hypothetical protein
LEIADANCRSRLPYQFPLAPPPSLLPPLDVSQEAGEEDDESIDGEDEKAANEALSFDDEPEFPES